MFKTSLNKIIISHTWKLANIVPIPKPNQDRDKGTSYKPYPSSHELQTLEKSLLPYKTANIPNTPIEHGYKTQHSTVTALHTLNNTVAKGFNQMAPPARTITVSFDMSKAFDTINIHTLIRKLLQTNIEQTNLPSSNNTYTKSTPKHIHHHYAPSVTSTHTTHISSTAPTYAPHCHPWICGQTPPELLSCWPDGQRSWLVDHKREHWTPPTSKSHGSG